MFLFFISFVVGVVFTLAKKPHHHDNNIIHPSRDNTTCQFGMYNFDARFDDELLGNWVLMTSKELFLLKDEFISKYNKNGGITTIGSWDTSENCCIEIDKQGTMLTIDQSVLFTAFAFNSELGCDSYTKGTTYVFWGDSTKIYYFPLNASNITFGTAVNCDDHNNPAIYMTKQCLELY